MTGSERAAFRAAANRLEAIQQVGHLGIGEQLIRNVDMALTARELIKLRVLETCPMTAREAADALAGATGAEVIQVIGYRFVLYRYNPEKHRQ